MKTKRVLFVLFAFLVACQSMNDTEKRNPESMAVKDGVFIHVTKSYDDPHRALMALKMAALMSSDKDVLVYMDIDAVRMLVKGSKDIESPEFESAHTYIKKLLDRKVVVYACPTCLAIAGFKPGDLLEGVQVAREDKFFSFTKGRIVNLDY